MQGSPFIFWQPSAQYLQELWLAARELPVGDLASDRSEFQRLLMAQVRGWGGGDVAYAFAVQYTIPILTELSTHSMSHCVCSYRFWGKPGVQTIHTEWSGTSTAGRGAGGLLMACTVLCRRMGW
jgi:hypothetical protein